MKIKLTIDMFSGRENPTLVLDGADAKKIIDQIQPKASFAAMTAQDKQEPARLGYRGVKVEQLENISAALPSLIHVTPDRLTSGMLLAATNDSEFEKNIFDHLDHFTHIEDMQAFRKVLKEQIDLFRSERQSFVAAPVSSIAVPTVNPCSCAQPADIAYWNTTAGVVGTNNCYNYATDYRTNTFAQPGKATGQQYTNLSACNVPAGQRSAKMGAISDGLIDTPNANNVCPGTGHLVALVIWPNTDYHWYRKNNDGYWSHKPGGTPATIYDNAGHLITDPRTANRGGYTQFCTFMQVIDGHFRIN